jgi:hypothetical protein
MNNEVARLMTVGRQQLKTHLWMQVPVLATKQLFDLLENRCPQ